MELAAVIVFLIGYLLIVFEHPLKLNKTVPALLSGVLIWAIIFLNQRGNIATFEEELATHLAKIAEILFFLKGAMTIVELIDLHKGFALVTKFVRTDSKVKLLWLIAFSAFFLSAVLDNLTTTIVLVSLTRKLLASQEDRLWFAAIIVIAANAGGAWSPIGDVTTTMLWIGNKTSATVLIKTLFLPSLVSLLVPLLLLSKNKYFRKSAPLLPVQNTSAQEQLLSSRTMLIVGVAALLFVPVFKTITHLPPYMGMLLALAIVWVVSEYIHPEEDFTEERKDLYSAQNALSRVDFSSILFFLGILLAIGGLESMHILSNIASQLDILMPNKSIVAVILGFISAILDNVPLVAAAMAMYQDGLDSPFWHFLAYSAGTGGSMLIIGSAAGVAAMGLEKIDFLWYLKKISLLALLGYLAGAAVFLLSNF
jgi:NhaD family Na+/H+ antiporter